MKEDLIYYLALSSNRFIGPKRYQKIVNNFNSIEDFLNLNPEEQMEFLNIKSPKAKRSFTNMKLRGEKILKKCKEKSINVITIDDENYPNKLKEISEPPYVLYYLGELRTDLKLIGIIGTRKPSLMAISLNKYFTQELVKYPLGIISGMAKGHDSIAQKVAINNNAYTISVMGCGVDIIYPKENKELYYNIISQDGCIISEYPPGTIPDKVNFPLRNRIISGLSDAILLIQAPEKSGALITAKYAEVQNKDLYVIPGDPSDPKNFGSNLLIQNGAKIALKPEDIILDLLGIKIENRNKNNSNIEINNINNLSDDEKLILNLLENELSIEELYYLTNIPLSKLNLILTEMELKGYIQQSPNRIYSKLI